MHGTAVDGAQRTDRRVDRRGRDAVGDELVDEILKVDAPDAVERDVGERRVDAEP